MTLNQWADAAFENSRDHGFWADLPADPTLLGTYLGNKMMLITGEVAEAHECLRDHPDPHYTWHREQDGKPEGLAYELADVLIRVFDLAGALDINLDAVVREKAAFNATRPMLHGKQF